MKRILLILLAAALLLLCAACGADGQAAEPAGETETQQPEQSVTEEPDEPSPAPEESQPDEQAQAAAQAQAEQATAALEEDEPEPEQEVDPYLICIDAGHQEHGSSEREPNGPGSSTMKARVTGGTRGTTTGLYEYELNLQVSLKLQEELESRGYTVLMVRTENDVDLSNAERSEIANEAGADAFVRIHANGSESSSASGAMTICMTPSNPYNGALYESSRALADAVLEGLTAATGAEDDGVWETDTMTGINWSEVPVTIVEMGYMTNPEEDRLMASEDYQWQLARGIADGIDTFFAAQEAAASGAEDEAAPEAVG